MLNSNGVFSLMYKESNNCKYHSNSVAQRKEHHWGNIVLVYFVKEHTRCREDGIDTNSKRGVEQTGDKVDPGDSKHLKCTQADRTDKDPRKQSKNCHYT